LISLRSLSMIQVSGGRGKKGREGLAPLPDSLT